MERHHVSATVIGLSRTACRRAHAHGPHGSTAVIYDLPTYVASGSRALAAAEAAAPTLVAAEQAAFERIYAALCDHSEPGPEAA